MSKDNYTDRHSTRPSSRKGWTREVDDARGSVTWVLWQKVDRWVIKHRVCLGLWSLRKNGRHIAVLELRQARRALRATVQRKWRELKELQK